jgi:hypothetical protein
MTERLLQYIWQLQYFNKTALTTTAGECLTILQPGNINTNQGPDFSNAKITVNKTTWAGHIELHILSSDWTNHNHSNDKNYANIILHVVWRDDSQLSLPFPTVELNHRVSKILLGRFDELMNAKAFIPCEKMIHQADELTWSAWKERLVVERLQKKSALVLKYLEMNNNNWSETFWWLIARNFGATVNSDAFEKIARSLPLNMLAKHKNQIHQVEALLFGQAGLLDNNFSEDYPAMLKKEYLFYQTKYRLQPVYASLHFLRMRPPNFPTVRLAQLAMLIHDSIHLFPVVKEILLLKEIKTLLTVTANDYWNYHYIFEEPTSFRKKNLGEQMINTILINTILPILFAYGHHHKEPVYKERVLRWMEEIAAEKNSVTNGYGLLGVQNKSAFDSQALIQLKHEYCDQKRCLECAVGNRLLKPIPATPIS